MRILFFVFCWFNHIHFSYAFLWQINTMMLSLNSQSKKRFTLKECIIMKELFVIE